MTDGTEAAFATPSQYTIDGQQEEGTFGLSKREFFSAMALQGLCQNRYTSGAANEAVKIADALIKCLNENGYQQFNELNKSE